MIFEDKHNLHIKTPCIPSIGLGEGFGRRVYVKMEAYQPTGSFKIRGIGYACHQAVQRGFKEFISSSGGNAGCAVAYSGKHLGAKVTVVVPKTTPENMKKTIAFLGADVIVHGANWDGADKRALEMAVERKAAYIPPFDLPDIWEGHSTLISELDEKPEGIVVAVGGGGLLMGVMVGLEKRGWQDVRVFSAETVGADSMAQSLLKRQLVELPEIKSIAHSLGAKRVSEEVFKKALDYGVTPIKVSDNSAIKACTLFADDHKALVEVACGAALAPIYENHPSLRMLKSVHVIVCGGLGVSLSNVCKWKTTEH